MCYLGSQTIACARKNNQIIVLQATLFQTVVHSVTGNGSYKFEAIKERRPEYEVSEKKKINTS